MQLRPQVTSDILSLAGQVDKKNKILSIKCTTLYPHPTDPDRAFMSTLEINKMGSMPKWASRQNSGNSLAVPPIDLSTPGALSSTIYLRLRPCFPAILSLVHLSEDAHCLPVCPHACMPM